MGNPQDFPNSHGLSNGLYTVLANRFYSFRPSMNSDVLLFKSPIYSILINLYYGFPHSAFINFFSVRWGSVEKHKLSILPLKTKKKTDLVRKIFIRQIRFRRTICRFCFSAELLEITNFPLLSDLLLEVKEIKNIRNIGKFSVVFFQFRFNYLFLKNRKKIRLISVLFPFS